MNSKEDMETTEMSIDTTNKTENRDLAQELKRNKITIGEKYGARYDPKAKAICVPGHGMPYGEGDLTIPFHMDDLKLLEGKPFVIVIDDCMLCQDGNVTFKGHLDTSTIMKINDIKVEEYRIHYEKQKKKQEEIICRVGEIIENNLNNDLSRTQFAEELSEHYSRVFRSNIVTVGNFLEECLKMEVRTGSFSDEDIEMILEEVNHIRRKLDSLSRKAFDDKNAASNEPVKRPTERQINCDEIRLFAERLMGEWFVESLNEELSRIDRKRLDSYRVDVTTKYDLAKFCTDFPKKEAFFTDAAVAFIRQLMGEIYKTAQVQRSRIEEAKRAERREFNEKLNQNLSMKQYISMVFDDFNTHTQNLTKLCKGINFSTNSKVNYSGLRLQEDYILRYTYAYGYEYQWIWSCLKDSGFVPGDIISLGCGNMVDYWAFREVHKGEDTRNIRYTGIDEIDWVHKFKEQPYFSQQFIKKEIGDFFKECDEIDYDTFLFPKSLTDIDIPNMNDMITCLMEKRIVSDRIALIISYAGERLMAMDKVRAIKETLGNIGFKPEEDKKVSVNCRGVENIHRIKDRKPGYLYPNKVLNELKENSYHRLPLLSDKEVNFEICFYRRGEQ